jgi:hypothetical protein
MCSIFIFKHYFCWGGINRQGLNVQDVLVVLAFPKVHSRMSCIKRGVVSNVGRYIKHLIKCGIRIGVPCLLEWS